MIGNLIPYALARRVFAKHLSPKRLVVGLQSQMLSRVQAHYSFSLVNHKDERKNWVRSMKA